MSRTGARPAAIAIAALALAGCGARGAGAGQSSGNGGGQAPASAAVAPDVGSGSPEARAALASCPEEVWPGDDSRAATHLGTHAGASVFRIAGGAGAPDQAGAPEGTDEPGAPDGAGVFVAVGEIRPGEAVGCVVLAPVDDPAPVAGGFWPLAGRVQAVVLGAAECHPESCPSALLIRDGARPLGALYLPEACDRALAMEALRWFTGQDSLRLTCHQSTGAGYRELVSVVHVGRSGPVPVFALETGSAEDATEEERATPGFCARRPVGWVRLVEKGERPVIRAFSPRGGQPGGDGKGTGPVADFRYDPDAQRFAQIGPRTLEAYDARAWCKQ